VKRYLATIDRLAGTAANRGHQRRAERCIEHRALQVATVIAMVKPRDSNAPMSTVVLTNRLKPAPR
jgi:hypothetical protein